MIQVVVYDFWMSTVWTWLALFVWEALDSMWRGMSPHCPFLHVVRNASPLSLQRHSDSFHCDLSLGCPLWFSLIPKLMSFQSIRLWGRYVRVLCWPCDIANKFKLCRLSLSIYSVTGAKTPQQLQTWPWPRGACSQGTPVMGAISLGIS